jgi:predicted PhzF superfamily epimerase YddE/YHI9
MQAVADLLQQVGLKMDHVDRSMWQSHDIPTINTVIDTDKDIHPIDTDIDAMISYPILNSSIARPKTLVPIQTLDLLHSAINPKDPDEFRRLCDSIDSTGLYLYTRVPSSTPQNDPNCPPPFLQDVVFECRQFPRASGYPEDPATGIAASALASSLYKRGMGRRESGDFVMYQGTAMKRHSRCVVRVREDVVFCGGSVELEEEWEWVEEMEMEVKNMDVK